MSVIFRAVRAGIDAHHDFHSPQPRKESRKTRKAKKSRFYEPVYELVTSAERALATELPMPDIFGPKADVRAQQAGALPPPPAMGHVYYLDEPLPPPPQQRSYAQPQWRPQAGPSRTHAQRPPQQQFRMGIEDLPQLQTRPRRTARPPQTERQQPHQSEQLYPQQQPHTSASFRASYRSQEQVAAPAVTAATPLDTYLDGLEDNVDEPPPPYPGPPLPRKSHRRRPQSRSGLAMVNPDS